MSTGSRVRDLETWLAASYSREATGDYSDLKLGPLSRVLTHLPAPPAPVTFAGTKGKGSTLRLVEAILLAHGERCLAFTSPHITQVTERWRRDGVPVDTQQARAAAERVDAAERATGAEVTYFERCFAIAVLLAAEHPGCRFLCEVGLGGRLDCANLLDAEIAVCTHLSRDHCHILGDTLSQIAGEKLAIARPQRPLVIAPQSPAAEAAIRTRLPACTPHWVAHEPELDDWPLGLRGEHQRDNLATALTVARLLLDQRFDPAAARRAVAATTLAARCQLITHRGRPLLIDGAHNGPSVAATIRVARGLWGEDCALIIGCATDKELDEILAALPHDPPPLRCGYTGPRARREHQWGPVAGTWPWHADIAAALDATDPTRPVCITGSFYLAAEALHHLGHDADAPG